MVQFEYLIEQIITIVNNIFVVEQRNAENVNYFESNLCFVMWVGYVKIVRELGLPIEYIRSTNEVVSCASRDRVCR